jgi:hypothetical protein
VVSRAIGAPWGLVFEAFTQVRHLSRWWGPEGFTTTTRSFEFRVGGAWDFVMHGPDGTDYQEWITWTEIVPPERPKDRGTVRSVGVWSGDMDSGGAELGLDERDPPGRGRSLLFAVEGDQLVPGRGLGAGLQSGHDLQVCGVVEEVVGNCPSNSLCPGRRRAAAPSFHPDPRSTSTVI